MNYTTVCRESSGMYDFDKFELEVMIEQHDDAMLKFGPVEFVEILWGLVLSSEDKGLYCVESYSWAIERAIGVEL
jgi:hypothetical protein